MKYYIEKNGKILIISSVMLMALSISLLTIFSYAATDGENYIYTRDELSEKVTNLEYDTGWVSLMPYASSGITIVDVSRTPYIRKIDNVVYIKGSITGIELVDGANTILFSGLPAEFRPTSNLYMVGALGGNTFKNHFFRIDIQVDGNIKSNTNTAGTLPIGTQFFFNLSYVVD